MPSASCCVAHEKKAPALRNGPSNHWPGRPVMGRWWPAGRWPLAPHAAAGPGAVVFLLLLLAPPPTATTGLDFHRQETGNGHFCEAYGTQHRPNRQRAGPVVAHGTWGAPLFVQLERGLVTCTGDLGALPFSHSPASASTKNISLQA